jgi:hypothetical protein
MKDKCSIALNAEGYAFGRLQTRTITRQATDDIAHVIGLAVKGAAVKEINN